MVQLGGERPTADAKMTCSRAAIMVQTLRCLSDDMDLSGGDCEYLAAIADQMEAGERECLLCGKLTTHCPWEQQ